jgi:hypothetical protein
MGKHEWHDLPDGERTEDCRCPAKTWGECPFTADECWSRRRGYPINDKVDPKVLDDL